MSDVRCSATPVRRMTIHWTLCVLALCLLCFWGTSQGQSQFDPSVNVGYTPFGSYHEDEITVVDLQKGNVEMHIPLVSYPQRGGKLKLGFTLWAVTQSNSWKPSTNTSCPEQGGPTCPYYYTGEPNAVGIAAGPSAGNGNPNALYVMDDQAVTLGATNLLAKDKGLYHYQYYAETPDMHSHPMGITPSGTLRSVDGTGYEALGSIGSVNNDLKYAKFIETALIDRDGVINYPCTACASTTATSGVLRADPSGNQITYTYSQTSPQGYTSYIDTVGRTIPMPPFGVASTSTGCTGPLPFYSSATWTLPGFQGTSDTYKLCYGSLAVNTNFPTLPTDSSEPTWIQVSGTFAVLQNVILPNGTAWTFEYNDRDPGDPASINYGTVTQITTPTGGTITFQYTMLYPNLCGSFNGNEGQIPLRAVSTKTLNANDGTPAETWKYQFPDTGSPAVTTVTDPLLNDTVHTFTNYSESAGICSFYENQTRYYQGSQSSGTLLKTVNTTYTYTAPIDVFTDGVDNVVATQVTTTLGSGSSAVTSSTVKQYDGAFTAAAFPEACCTIPTSGTTSTLGDVTTETVYDYGTPGSGAAGGVLRTTTRTYEWQNNASYLSADLVDDVASSVITNGSTKFAEVDSAYDETGNGSPNCVCGNLTSVTNWLNTGASPKTQYVYNTQGMRTKTFDPIDPKGLNPTLYTYDSTGAFFSKVQYPTTSGVTHIENYSFDSSTGLLASFTDQNNNKTSYNWDEMRRPLGVTYPSAGGSIAYAYNNSTPTPSVTYTRTMTSTQNYVAVGFSNGLGRPTETEVTSDPDGITYKVQTYDLDGRVATVYNATRCSPPTTECSETTWGYTSTAYDALGRPLNITEPDGSVVVNTYSGNQTTETDETGNERTTEVDALGRVTHVWESPNNTKYNYQTVYTFDALDNLLSVVQNGGRTRTFTYDSLSRLVCAANPEVQVATCPSSATGTFPAGAITYTYDANSNLLTRVAPRPDQTGTATATTSYSYDALNRLTEKAYAGVTTPTVQFGFDGTSLTGCGQAPPNITSPTNLIGRRSAICAGASASSFSFDAMGRVVQESRTNVGSAAQTFSVRYTYYQDGSLNTLTYPSGDVVTYTVGGARRATQLSDATNGYVGYSGNSAKYTPDGSIASMTNGHTSSFAGIVTANAYNSRLQPILLSAGVSSSVFSLCYDFHSAVAVSSGSCSFSAYATGNNGNVFQVLNNVDSTRSTVFAYDPLNRIQQANTVNTTSANCWGEVYTIDAWGNLTNRAGVTGMSGSCSTEGLSFTANGQNQLSGFSYDAAGNVTNDGNGNAPTHDVENRIVTDAGVTYSYDADGVRIEKSSGTMYWTGPGGEYLAETNLAGTINEEYVYFDGARIARVDRPSGTVHYYFSDHLGSASVITSATGGVTESYFYYPYGGMQSSTGSDPNHYKYNGKERDSESSLDQFGARYYASAFGRFLTPDWAAKPTAVPYANFSNPQSLNLYSYAENNPTTSGDPDGHGTWYDPKGKKLGTDGIDDGSVHVANKSDVVKVNGIVDASRTSDVFNVSARVGVAIQDSVARTLAPSVSSTGSDLKGGFHEEGFTVDSNGIHIAPPGPAYQPTQSEAHINLTVSSDTTVEEHTHPAGETNSNTIGGTHFDQEPSPTDVKNAANTPGATHIEAAAGDKTVYFYDQNGVKAKVPLSAFPTSIPGCGSNKHCQGYAWGIESFE